MGDADMILFAIALTVFVGQIVVVIVRLAAPGDSGAGEKE